MINSNEIENHITHFRLRAHRKARAHYLASKSLANRHLWIGIPIIIISTIVGSSAIIEHAENSIHFTSQALASLSLIAATLSAFQTFFGFSNQSVKHKSAASQYNAIYRKMSLLHTKYLSNHFDKQLIFGEIESIQKDWDAIESKALDVPDRLYDKAKKEQLSDDEGV